MLVDVLVATILLAVALTVLLGMTGTALRSQRQGQQLQTAAMLVDEQLNLVLARGPDDYAARFETEGSCEAPFEHYSYRLEFSGGDGGGAFRVVATVAWTDAGRLQTASVETMIAPRLGEEPDPDRRPEQPAVRY